MNRRLDFQMGNRCSAWGFSLIELMIVVAIVAILAAIAYPSYTHYVIKTRRVAGAACVSEIANYMERYYTTNMRYDQDAAAVANGVPNLDCSSPAQTGNNYAYTLNPMSANAYTVIATPQGPQVADTDCGVLTLDQAGKRTKSGTDTLDRCF